MMLYIEDLVLYISNPNNKVPFNQMSKKDIGVVMNIANQIKNNLSMTEGQSNLLLKILTENQTILSQIPSIELLLSEPKFKFTFRKVDTTRKISLITEDGKRYLSIKFPFNNRINGILHSISTRCEFNKATKSYMLPLTTPNLHAVVHNLKDHGFLDIEQSIVNWYSEMEAIKSNPTLYIPTLTLDGLQNVNQHTQSYFDTQKKNNLISDIVLAKSLGIHISKEVIDAVEKLNVTSVTQQLATAHKNKITINSNSISMSLLVNSLKEIDTFPIVIILHDDQTVDKVLENWYIELTNIGIQFNEMSVLFRSSTNKELNEFIKSCNLNNMVTDDTKVVFIKQKVPKILFKIGFKPKLIIGTSKTYAHFTAQKMVDAHPFVLYYTNQVTGLEYNIVNEL